MRPFAILCLLVFVAGCASPWSRKTGRSAVGIKDGRPALTQSGDVEAPARANTETAVTVLPIPAGSVVSVTSRGAPTIDESRSGVSYQEAGSAGASQFAVTLSQASELRTETRRDTVEGAKTYAPPAPPSAADLSDAKALWVYRIGLGVGVAMALFGLVRGWNLIMYGGIAVAGACAVGLFVQRHPALFGIMGGGIALALAGAYVWHAKLKKVPPEAFERAKESTRNDLRAAV